MLFGIDARKICEAHPQLGRNACSWNRIDVARCVKQRLVTPSTREKFAKPCRITFSSSTTASGSNVSFADLIGEAIVVAKIVFA
jgi:hypothetical protein